MNSSPSKNCLNILGCWISISERISIAYRELNISQKLDTEVPKLTLRIASDTNIDVLAVMTVTTAGGLTTDADEFVSSSFGSIILAISSAETEMGVSVFVFDSQFPSSRVYPEAHSVQADERQAVQKCTVH